MFNHLHVRPHSTCTSGRLSVHVHIRRHRQHFRSDVLVTFHPPMTFTPAVRFSCMLPEPSHSLFADQPRIARSSRLCSHSGSHRQDAAPNLHGRTLRPFLAAHPKCEARRAHIRTAWNRDESRRLHQSCSDVLGGVQDGRDEG